MNEKQAKSLSKWLSIIGYKQDKVFQHTLDYYCKVCKSHLCYDPYRNMNLSKSMLYKGLTSAIRYLHPHWFEFSVLCVGLDKPKWLME